MDRKIFKYEEEWEVKMENKGLEFGEVTTTEINTQTQEAMVVTKDIFPGWMFWSIVFIAFGLGLIIGSAVIELLTGWYKWAFIGLGFAISLYGVIFASKETETK